jgi:acetyl esterase/lipase
MTTYIYKRVGGLEIKADVYRAGDERPRPVIVWIHGGALMMGHRGWIDERVKSGLLDAGYALVSIDYRLAPETKLPAILEDVEDAFRWVREEGPELFQAEMSRIAVVGASAGGYLTLASGYRVRPRPAALVAFYGYGDLVGEWYSGWSRHARHRQSRLTDEEACRQVGGPPISDTRERDTDRGAFYQYCRRWGLWPKVVSGWDPRRETETFRPFLPVLNVTREFPPTLLIHGTEDTDVPYEQSVMMAEELRKHGVEHELFTIPGGEHGLIGGQPERIDAAYEAALVFVNHHMQRAGGGG